jgi:predicted transcriptional regulator
MLGKNRDRIGIIADILVVTRGGSSKTGIMFGAGLSFSLLEKYLDIVVNSGLVLVKSSRYELTEQGQEFLRQYRKFEEQYLKAQESLEALDLERQRLDRLCERQKLAQTIRSY